MNDHLTRNLTVLRDRNEALAGRIAQAPARAAVEIRTARSGARVPVMLSGGRARALHSLEDPVREGERLAASFFGEAGKSGSGRGETYLVIAGLGAGYHIAPFLSSPEIERILIVDHDIGLVRALFEGIDYTTLLADARVTLLVAAHPAELRGYLLQDYLPALHGGFRYLSLRSVADLDRGYFDSVELELRKAVASAADDFRAQTAFGLRWFKNILANLPLLAQKGRIIPGTGEVAVVGAGPSLDGAFGELLSLSATMPVISADTAFPVLKTRGLHPQYVLTIDCQQHGYHHYLSGLPAETALVADLAAPPDVVRLQEAPLFVSGGHPFVDYVERRLRAPLHIDSSGGNVGHAATSFALALGARRIHFFGLDFCYPRGATYARGSYLSPYFLSRQRRLRPLETQDVVLFLDDPSLRREAGVASNRYRTDRLDAYRARFENAFAGPAIELVPHGSEGVPLVLEQPLRPAGREDNPKPLAVPAIRAEDVRRILEIYRAGLESLPPPGPLASVEGYVASLPQNEIEVFVTLLPLLAWTRGSELGRSMSFREAVETTIATARGGLAGRGAGATGSEK